MLGSTVICGIARRQPERRALAFGLMMTLWPHGIGEESDPIWQQNGDLTVLQNPSPNSVADDPKKGSDSMLLGGAFGGTLEAGD
mgnify:CR=1 FL=1